MKIQIRFALVTDGVLILFRWENSVEDVRVLEKNHVLVLSWTSIVQVFQTLADFVKYLPHNEIFPYLQDGSPKINLLYFANKMSFYKGSWQILLFMDSKHLIQIVD